MTNIFGYLARRRPEMSAVRPTARPWVLSALGFQARLVFAAVLSTYFLISAASKIGGSDLSMGPDVTGTFLSLGAFYSLAPVQLEVAGGAPAMLSIAVWIAVHGLVMAEALLPVLLVVGLATRFAALGLIGLVIMTSAIDVFGHGAPPEAVGSLFDASPYDQILDLRLLWIMLLTVPAALGGGWLSIDVALRTLRRRRARRPAE